MPKNIVGDVNIVGILTVGSLNFSGVNITGLTSLTVSGLIACTGLVIPTKIDTNVRTLTNSNNTIGIDWENSLLRDNANRTTARYSDMYLISTYDSNLSIDWGLRRLYDPGVNISLDWNARNLKDGGNIVLNWSDHTFPNTRWAFCTGLNVTGTLNVTGIVNATGVIVPNAIDTTVGKIYRSNGSISIDYENRLLYANGVSVIDYGNFLLKRDSGVTIIDWYNSTINDGTGAISVQGEAHRLQIGGSVRLDWSARTLGDSAGAQLNWGTKILLDGPWSATGGFNVTGNLRLGAIGNELQIASGANASVGTAVLVGGAITVANTLVTANSLIMLTVQGGTVTNVGSPYVSGRVNATSFVIASTNPADTSTVGYQIIERI